MNHKKIIAVMLSVFVLMSVGVLIYKSLNSSEVVTTGQGTFVSEGKKIKDLQDRRIDATYFHVTQRCYTCNVMEKYIRETIDKNFSDHVESGVLNLQSINVEENGNHHYVQDYKLYTKSFILSLKNKDKEEKWLNCDKIWKLARNEKMFKKYIRTEVEKYLGLL